jgi:organic hydroperoxide reductase OsmC/OhrA
LRRIRLAEPSLTGAGNNYKSVNSGTGANPEQLFAAGWSACFLSAIKLAAGKRKVALHLGAGIVVGNERNEHRKRKLCAAVGQG